MTSARRSTAPVWDASRWRIRVVLRRLRTWIVASPWRRRIAWFMTFVVLVLVVPAALGAVATAQSGAAQASDTANSALSWMNIEDSDGVPVASYMFATDTGGVLSPIVTITASLLLLVFVGWLVIVTTAIWLIGYVLSFAWLDYLGGVLNGVADRLSGQIATPVVLTAAVTFGAFFVAYFVIRGFHAKATMQVVSMLGVALFGAYYLAHPLAEVLSSDGWLAQGRNVGIAVAAGLNGNSQVDPANLVATMQADLADNIARKPLQVWNFGHVIDEQPSCRAAWSSGVRSGDREFLVSAVEHCGDYSAAEAARNPGFGQIGAGVVILICGAIVLLFAVVLGLRVLWAALDSVYHGFMAIFGFAAGGFVYGPTQTFLVRNIVDSMIAAASMAVYTVFLGVYLLFLADIFEQARGQEVRVLFVAAIVEIVAIRQLRRLAGGLADVGDHVSGRLASAMQGNAGSGGEGFAMGPGSGGSSALPAGLFMAGLAAMNTINNNPAFSWLAYGTPSPLMPLAQLKKSMDKKAYDMHDFMAIYREGAIEKARENAALHGGINTAEGIANVADVLGDLDVRGEQKIPIYEIIGGRTPEIRRNARYQMTQQARKNAVTNKDSFMHQPLAKTLASAIALHETPLTGPYAVSPAEHAICAAALAVDSANFRRSAASPDFWGKNPELFDLAIQDDFGSKDASGRRKGVSDAFLDAMKEKGPEGYYKPYFVEFVLNNAYSEKKLSEGLGLDVNGEFDQKIFRQTWDHIGSTSRRSIGKYLAIQMEEAAKSYSKNPVDANWDRVNYISGVLSNLAWHELDRGRSPWHM